MNPIKKGIFHLQKKSQIRNKKKNLKKFQSKKLLLPQSSLNHLNKNLNLLNKNLNLLLKAKQRQFPKQSQHLLNNKKNCQSLKKMNNKMMNNLMTKNSKVMMMKNLMMTVKRLTLAS